MTGPSPLRVVITDCDLGSTALEERVLTEQLGAVVQVAACRTEGDVIKAGLDADALMVQWAPVTEAVVGSLTRCRLISRYGIGLDMIDVDAASRRGIAVANVSGYCVEEVATHAVSMLLALYRHLPQHDRSLRDGTWAPKGFPDTLRLSEATLGLVGVGRIGSLVARVFSALGTRVIGYDPAPAGAPGIEFTSLDDVLAQSDLISLHCPLTPATRHIVDAAALEAMKPTAVLVNTARGGLVDQQALVSALERGTIAAAGVDVFEVEPLPAASPLLLAPNLLVTPHTAWYSRQALPALQAETVQNVVDFFQGRDVRSLVNAGALAPVTLEQA